MVKTRFDSGTEAIVPVERDIGKVMIPVTDIFNDFLAVVNRSIIYKEDAGNDASRFKKSQQFFFQPFQVTRFIVHGYNDR
jgi:hypothetical protein